MNTHRHLMAVVTSCAAALCLAAPPPPSSAATTPKPTVAAEYPLSCSGLSKPIVLEGWDAMANSRMDEARQLLKEALVADPKCVLARATLANLTPGLEGKKLFEEALKDTSTLTEIEGLDLQAMQASRNADAERAYMIAQKMVALAPNVFFVNLAVAHYAFALERFDDAAVGARMATELSPLNGAGWNLLGYARLSQKKNAEAVTAFRKYLELSPNEPNAHDSLADALLANNQLDEAGFEYQLAIDDSKGKFWFSGSGVATVKALKGDFAGARAALAIQKAAARLPNDKVKTELMTAWTWIAQGKLPEALKVVDSARKQAAAAKLDYSVAHANVVRGQLNLVSGKYAEALKDFTAADKAKVDTFTDGQKKFHRGLVLLGLTETQARLGKTAEAEKALTTLDAFIKSSVTGPFATDALAYGHGVVALVRKDPLGAVDSLKRCSDQFDYCRMTFATAQEKAGDPVGAAETRASLLRANHREPEYWFVRAHLEAKEKAKQVGPESAM